MAQALTPKQQYWSNKLKEAEQAGQSLADYARIQNLPAQKLYQWRSTLKNITTSVTQETQFTRVVTTTAPVSSELIVQISGAQLRFASLPDPKWLSRLLARDES